MNLITPGAYPEQRDQQITQEFLQFIDKPKQPIFNFLFYDNAHAYCTPQTFQGPFQPAIAQCNRMFLNSTTDPVPYFNRYKNALHFVDEEVGKVLDGLQQKGLLQNSIVIITGDHGQEFNDNHLDYWEHASNFTRYQLHTPLIIYGLETKPRVIDYPTSNYDVVPTLLQNIFHCKNPIADYSVGKNLFNPYSLPYLIVGSYAHMGIVLPDQIINLLTSGEITVQDLHARPLGHAMVSKDLLRDVLKLMTKYYYR